MRVGYDPKAGRSDGWAGSSTQTVARGRGCIVVTSSHHNSLLALSREVAEPRDDIALHCQHLTARTQTRLSAAHLASASTRVRRPGAQQRDGSLCTKTAARAWAVSRRVLGRSVRGPALQTPGHERCCWLPWDSMITSGGGSVFCCVVGWRWPRTKSGESTGCAVTPVRSRIAADLEPPSTCP